MGCSAGTQVKNDKLEQSSHSKSKQFNNSNTSNNITSQIKLNSKFEKKYQNSKYSSKIETDVSSNFKDEIEKIISNFNQNFNYFSVKLCKLSVYKLKYSYLDNSDNINFFSEKKYFLVREKVQNKLSNLESKQKIKKLKEDLSKVSSKFHKNFQLSEGLKLFERLSLEFKIICINNESFQTIQVGSGMENKLVLLFFDIINSEAIEKIKQINNLLNSRKDTTKFKFFPLINYFYKPEDFSFPKDFLRRVGFEDKNVYLLVKDDSLIELFGLDNLITSRVFIIDQTGEVKLICEADKLTEEEIDFYLNINYEDLTQNKDNNLLGKYNLFDHSTYNLMKQVIINSTREIKSLSLASNLNYNEIIISKASIFEENISVLYFPIKINLLHNNLDTDKARKINDYFSKEIKNFFLNEKIKVNEKDMINEAIKIINTELKKRFSFFKEEESTIEKRVSKSYNKANKLMYVKSSNLSFNFKLINNNYCEKCIELQNFLSELIYTNPNISKIDLRYLINPKEGLQYKRTLRSYKDKEGSSDLTIISKNFSSKNKLFLVINSNILYQEESVRNCIAEYINFLTMNKRKFDTDIFFITIGQNPYEMNKIQESLSLENCYFWFMTGSSFAEFNFYNEDFSIIAIVLDWELKLQYIEDIKNMKKECYEKPIFANNVLKHLTYFSKKIDKENFQKIKVKFDKFCEELNEKYDSLHNLIPCCRITYEKVINYLKNERKNCFYKKCYLEIKLPDFFVDLISEFLDEFIYEINKLDEEYGFYVGKSLNIYETTELPVKEFRKCSLCIKNVDLKAVYYCNTCEDAYCESCESKLNNINIDESKPNKKTKHEHNLIFFSIRDKIDNRRFFIYSMLIDNYTNSNSNTKSYKKCCLCENYIYPEDKIVYLNLTEISNWNSNMEQFICNDSCFKDLLIETGQKSEEFLKNVNKNKINRKNLVFLKIYWEIDN